MNQTPLHDLHVALGATMVNFAGWSMPVSYAGTVSEIMAVRQNAGLFDVSHMGEFKIFGPDAFGFIQSVVSNDISRLKPGDALYSLLLNDDGGVVDDIIVYKLDATGYMIVVNAGCLEGDWTWFERHADGFDDAVLVNDSAITSLIALQGPQAVAIGTRVFGEQFARLERFQFALGRYEGVPITVSRTGYTGEDGFEIFCENRGAENIWNALSAEGAVPAGLAARDVLRLEAAYALYGHELDAVHSPWESGVGWAVKLNKGEFVGRAAAEARRLQTDHKLVGVVMNTKAIPREGCIVYEASGETAVGIVTSGTFSPMLQQGVAMARVTLTNAVPGTDVMMDIRGRKLGAKVVKLPFYRNGV